MPTLFVIRGTDQGSRFELTEATIRVGRDSSSDITLHDAEVSRHHAEIRKTENDYAISDLNSSNGTWVNGQRVRRHPLASGDQLQLGRHPDALHRAGRGIARRSIRHCPHRFVGRGHRSVAHRSLGDAARRQQNFRAKRQLAAKFMARPSSWQSGCHVSHRNGRQPDARYRPPPATNHGVDFRMGRSRSRLHHAHGAGHEKLAAQSASHAKGRPRR